MNLTKNCFESITLTHIINPHMFWFRPESSYSNEKLSALEESLYKHFCGKKVLDKNRVKFNIGEMAAVFMETWDKWIRVIVDKHIKMLHGKIKCVLWAVDWGFPLQTNLERLRKLPIECATFENQHLFFAGLNSIIPSETTFDLTLLKSVEVHSKEWSDLVVKEFRKLIDQASNIKFIPTKERSGGLHIFGRLQITTHNGINIDANDVLLQISGVMQIENSKQFFLALQNCNTTKIQRYNNNFNRLSFGDLNYDKVTSKILDMEYKLDNDFFNIQTDLSVLIPSRNIVDKVIEWDRRNYKTNSVVEYSECESEQSTLIMEDEAFESISCYDQTNIDHDLNITNSHSNRNYYDDEEDFCFVNRCDLIRQNIRKKYQNKMPRDPTISFELIQESAPLNVEGQKNSSVLPSSYLQKIIDKRKKMIEMEMSNSSTSVLSNDSDTGVTVTSSKISYLDKLKEKRERALKGIEDKNSSINSTVQVQPKDPVRDQALCNSNAKTEYVYDKKEQERREKLQQSIRGNDRNISLYPVDYPVSQITKEIMESKKYQRSVRNESQQPVNYHDQRLQNQDRQNINSKRNSNQQSLQQRLDKYNASKTNAGFDKNPSEAESEVW